MARDGPSAGVFNRLSVVGNMSTMYRVDVGRQPASVPAVTLENSPYLCEICRRGLDPESPGTAKRVTGWVKNGSTALRRPGPATAWAHWVCVETGSAGVSLEEPTLF